VAVKVKLLLADAAEAAGSGKVSALGLGWSAISLPMTPTALVLFIDLQQGEFARHEFRIWLSLLGQDDAVSVGEEDSDATLEFRGAFEAEALKDAGENAPGRVSLALNVAPLPLSPGHAYEWRAEIDGIQNDDWSAPFFVRRSEPEAARIVAATGEQA
jgi:hypothetical protein